MCTLFFQKRRRFFNKISLGIFPPRFINLIANSILFSPPPLFTQQENKKTVTDLFSIYCSLPIFFFPSPSYISHRSPAYRTRCITVPLSLVKLAKQMFNRDNEQAQIAFSLVHESFERGKWTRTQFPPRVSRGTLSNLFALSADKQIIVARVF